MLKKIHEVWQNKLRDISIQNWGKKCFFNIGNAISDDFDRLL